MTKAEILNRHQAVHQRLRHWLRDPMVIPAEAARLAGVTRPRMQHMLRAGLVLVQGEAGQQSVSVMSLLAYYEKSISKLSAGDKSRPRAMRGSPGKARKSGTTKTLRERSKSLRAA